MATIEINLDEFDDSELLAEVVRRGLGETLQDTTVNMVVQRLELLGCPQSILDDLRRWWRPVVTKEHLQRWIEAQKVVACPLLYS